MRKLATPIISLVCLALFASCAEDQAEMQTPEENVAVEMAQSDPGQKRVLAILGDPWHAVAPLHSGLLGGLIEDGWYNMTVIDYNVPWDDLDSFDLIVMVRNGVHHVDLYRKHGGSYEFFNGELTYWLTPEQEEKFVDYVDAGGSLLLFHDGFGHYKCGNGVARLAKACFITHPPQEEIEVTTTGIMPELAEGITPFVITEEEFVVEMDESQTSVYLESFSEKNGRSAQAWAHPFGEGKVVVFIPGHHPEVINHPMVQRGIQNALDWLVN
jgi:hypothetical protein